MSFFTDDAFLEMPRGPASVGTEVPEAGGGALGAGKPIRRHPRRLHGEDRHWVSGAEAPNGCRRDGGVPRSAPGRLRPPLERRLRAGLLLDAMMAAEVVQAGLGQPIMWITRDADTMRLDRRRARAVLHPAQSTHPTITNQISPHDAETVVGA